MSQLAPAQTHPSIARCYQAWQQVREQSQSDGNGDVRSSLEAAKAYRLAMPALESADAVSQFIACVTYGLLLGAIAGTEATRLLYAAQLARESYREQRPPRK